MGYQSSFGSGWLGTMIFPISASQVAGITGVRGQVGIYCFNVVILFSVIPLVTTSGGLLGIRYG
jgi:hypothetical protein